MRAPEWRILTRQKRAANPVPSAESSRGGRRQPTWRSADRLSAATYVLRALVCATIIVDLHSRKPAAELLVLLPFRWLALVCGARLAGRACRSLGLLLLPGLDSARLLGGATLRLLARCAGCLFLAQLRADLLAPEGGLDFNHRRLNSFRVLFSLDEIYSFCSAVGASGMGGTIDR